jgi:translation elongation factor EF-Tu-like GTPase
MSTAFVVHLLAATGLTTVLLAAPASSSGGEALVSADFRMPVVDAFEIKGTGTVVTGKIDTGYVRKGATLCLEGVDGRWELQAIEQFRKISERAAAGEHAGLLFTGLPDELASASPLVFACN